jgi:hypothetical protein
MGWKGVDRTFLAEDRQKWQAVVKQVMGPSRSTACGKPQRGL